MTSHPPASERRPEMTQQEFNHFLQNIDALSPEQMRQLRRELDSKLDSPAAAEQPDLTPEELAGQELQRRLFEAGILSEIKPPRRLMPERERSAPVPIAGEPLSETVIRERR